MSSTDLPPEQQAIRDKCFHPTGTFIEFKKEEIEQTIQARFEQQVRNYPDRLAIKTRSRQITYDELNKVANRVAHAILAQRGKGLEPVAILVEQGLPEIVAILACLKAGKIFIQIDPSLPGDRIIYMLEDSQTGLIVTNLENFPRAAELASNRFHLLDMDALDSTMSVENPDLSISPDTAAHIGYTSGSTGRPKGSSDSHRRELFDLMYETNFFHICAEDRLSHLVFARSGGQVFRALLNGSAIFPMNIKEEGLTGLANWLMEEGITFYQSVPTLFRHFVGTLKGGEQFPKLRLVRLQGEPVYKSDADLFQSHFASDCILVNSISATETGLFRLQYVDQSTRISGSLVPVGYKVEGKEVFLLDDSGQEVGFNQIGEIAVKSSFLRQRYGAKPAMAQAASLPDPEMSSECIYQTGDLGRMLDDGCLIHLGRKDFQVKVRGNRIEIPEIEQTLLNLDNIKEAVVVALEGSPGEPRLVAYVSPASQPAPTVTALRSGLVEALPIYMIPSSFVIMNTLPILPNGKVDRGSLPSPGSGRPELENPFMPPRTPAEEALAEIWVEVLGLDEVGISDHFLELGGNSLLASQVISRVIKTFKVEVPLRSLFESPTVADMAVVILQNQAKEAQQEDLDRMLAELEALSVDEATQLLADEGIASN